MSDIPKTSYTFRNPAADTVIQFQKLCNTINSTIPSAPGINIALQKISDNYKNIICDPLIKTNAKMLEDFRSRLSKAIYGSSGIPKINAKFSEEIQSQFSQAFSRLSSASFTEDEVCDQLHEVTKSLITPENISSIIQENNVSSETEAPHISDDYVVLSNDAVEEFELSSKLVEPIPGQDEKVKMDTSTFVSILSLIFTILQFIVGMTNPPTQPTVIQNYYDVTIYILGNSADYSNSSLKNILPDFQVISEVPLPEDGSSE